MRPVLLSDTVHTDSFTVHNNNNKNTKLINTFFLRLDVHGKNP